MKFTESEAIFLKKCNAQNLSTATITNYKYCLKTFFDFCQKRNITDIEQVNQYNVMDFMSFTNQNYRCTTARDKFVVIKAYFTYLTDIGIIDINPMIRMKKPKTDNKIIYSFNKQDITDIMNNFDKGEFIGFRNYTIMNILFGTGIRKSELLNIALSDFDWACNTIKIYGKGRKERLVPMGYTLQKIVLAYIRKRKEYLAEHKYNNSIKLFISKDGRPLSVGGLNTLFRFLRDGKKTWSTRVSAHTFRHTLAKYFLLNGGDLFTLQKILGHEDISITRLYVDLNNSEIQTQNYKYNPLDNNKWQYF